MDKSRLLALGRDPAEVLWGSSGELSVGIQRQPMPSFHVGVFGELPLLIDLPNNPANNILEEHLALLVNDNAGTGMSADSAGEQCQ
jgi:hypothetical protein